MAFMIPEVIRKSATAGEQLLFSVLKKVLPDDYIVYYEPRIRTKCRSCDYLILAPDKGILVIEVKDYTEKTIVEMDHRRWRIQRSSDGKVETKPNPILQARDYSFAISDLLARDEDLVQVEGKYAGRLKFPYMHSVAFTRLRDPQLERLGIFDVIEDNLVFSRDDIDIHDPDFDESRFLEKLWGMFSYGFRCKLTPEDIDGIRAALFPEVRLGKRKEKHYKEDDLLNLKTRKSMDLHQELLARQMGDGHRLLRGVAGSGKTLILAARTQVLLQQNPNWRILILTFGSPLANWIKGMLGQRFEDDPVLLKQITVVNFNRWLFDNFALADDSDLDNYYGKNQIKPELLYDAILIDEGQDFKGSWLRLVLRCLNPDTQSFLLVEDRAQDIFKRKTSLSQETGLDFRGRSKVLSINYRNTREILDLSWSFYKEFGQSPNRSKEEISDLVEIIPPRATNRTGSYPTIRKMRSLQEEVNWISRSLKKLHDVNGVAYRDMAVLYRAKKFNDKHYAESLLQALDDLRLPYYWITQDNRSKREYDSLEDSIKISTLDSSKGLDFRVVFIMGVELCPFPLNTDPEREASLVYIGMTRSMELLALTYSGSSDYTKWLDTKRR